MQSSNRNPRKMGSDKIGPKICRSLALGVLFSREGQKAIGNSIIIILLKIKKSPNYRNQWNRLVLQPLGECRLAPAMALLTALWTLYRSSGLPTETIHNRSNEISKQAPSSPSASSASLESLDNYFTVGGQGKSARLKTFLAALVCVYPSVFLLLPAHQRLDWSFTALVRFVDCLLTMGWRRLWWRTAEAAVEEIDAAQKPLFGGVLLSKDYQLSSRVSLGDRCKITADKFENIVSQLAPVGLFVWSCWEIIFAWFYYPQCLPPAYVHWLSKMAEMDSRLIDMLRHFREGKLEYGQRKGYGLEMQLADYCRQNGIDPKAGDVAAGFIKCSAVVHPGRSCVENAGWRWQRGFRRALWIYLPLYFLPVLVKRMIRLKNAAKISIRLPSDITGPSGKTLATSTTARIPQKYDVSVDIGKAVVSAARSAAFLATFISLVWAVICTVRNRTKTDSPLGPWLASFLCGWSLLLERPGRRPELALYCTPRALWCWWYRRGSCFRQPSTSQQSAAVMDGRLSGLVLASSLAGILTCWRHDRDSLRASVQTFLSIIL